MPLMEKKPVDDIIQRFNEENGLVMTTFSGLNNMRIDITFFGRPIKYKYIWQERRKAIGY